ncbi:unnamed protein product [Prorocentrum cordatum]|uniref:Uncharacterized protein n=1 Tax=Prorocentrum cordatum TaxID=2364126 RepID=A0ABN9TAQ3_9DINO|nr:unnamed protein product [Polarella glacialis]
MVSPYQLIIQTQIDAYAEVFLRSKIPAAKSRMHNLKENDRTRELDLAAANRKISKLDNHSLSTLAALERDLKRPLQRAASETGQGATRKQSQIQKLKEALLNIFSLANRM